MDEREEKAKGGGGGSKIRGRGVWTEEAVLFRLNPQCSKFNNGG